MNQLQQQLEQLKTEIQRLEDSKTDVELRMTTPGPNGDNEHLQTTLQVIVNHLLDVLLSI